MTDRIGHPDFASQVREFVVVARRRRWSILGVTGLVVAGALAILSQLTPLYQSEAAVLVKPVALAQGRFDRVIEPNMRTEKELALSANVATIALAGAEQQVPLEEFREPLRVGTAPNTEILDFSYSHNDPLQAQVRAQAFARAYLDFRRGQVLTDLKAAATPIQRRIASLNAQLTTVNGRLNAAPDRATQLALQAEANTLIGQMAIEQQNLASLAKPDDVLVGEIVEPALLPKKPASPNLLKNGVFALIAGLALAIGIALLRERFEDQIRTRDDLQAATDLPVLGSIPLFEGGREGGPETLVLKHSPHTIAAESYRALRTSVLFAAAREGAKTLLVTSAVAGEGKSTTVANLAIALAHVGKSVVVVCADMRQSQLPRMLGVPKAPGLANILLGETEIPKAIVLTSINGLSVVPGGPPVANSSELLGSDAMRKFLAEVAERADHVLVDSGPLLAVADPLMLAPLCDAVLLVASAGTSRLGARRARQQLKLVDAHVIGGALNKLDPSQASTGDYYSEYASGHDPAESTSPAERAAGNGSITASEPTLGGPGKPL